MEEGEQHMEEYSDEDKIEMRNANIAFLLTAAAAATSSALDLFLYKWQVKVTGTDADGEDEDQVIAFSSEYTMMTAEEITTPYWRYASLIMDWTCFTVMSTLTVTQLLSMFGIAASTNLTAWHYGGMVAGLMTLVAYIMSFLGAKAGWDVAKEDAEDDVIDGNGAAGLAYAEDIKYDWMKWMAAETSMTLMGFQYGKDWMDAQWAALSDEERASMEEKHGKEGKRGGHDDDDHVEEPSRLLIRELYGI